MFIQKLLPDLHVNSIYDLNLIQLKERGIKGIITDLDNTLIEWDRPQATPELVEWLLYIKKEGLQVVVVSNNHVKRVDAFAKPLGIPYISRAKKPFNRAFKSAQEMMQLQAEEVVVIGDQLFTDILGGNRLSLYTILVTPVAQSDGFFTRFNRLLERVALSRLRRKGLLSWGGKEDSNEQ